MSSTRIRRWFVHAALVTLVVGSFQAADAETRAGLAEKVALSTVGTANLINDSGEKAVGTLIVIMPQAHGSSPGYVRVRICNVLSVECDDYSKTLGFGDFWGNVDATSINATVAGLGLVQVTIASESSEQEGSVWAWVYPETQTSVSFAGSPADGARVRPARVLVQSGSVWGPWTATSSSLSFNAEDLSVAWAQV